MTLYFMQLHKSYNILTIVRPFQSFVDQKLLMMKQVLSVYILHDYVPCFQVIRQELLFKKATVDITQINGFYALFFDVTCLKDESINNSKLTVCKYFKAYQHISLS